MYALAEQLIFPFTLGRWRLHCTARVCARVCVCVCVCVCVYTSRVSFMGKRSSLTFHAHGALLPSCVHWPFAVDFYWLQPVVKISRFEHGFALNFVSD